MTDDDSLRRFRSAVEPPDDAAWAAVRGAVQREIEADGEQPKAGPAIKRRRSPRLLAAALATLTLTGAAAYAATTLIGVGSPAPNPPSPFTPSNVRLLGLRIADPAGGPPWGIRLALTQPGRPPGWGRQPPDVAIQIGRIRAGQMGFIGVDGVFHNDGLFHVAGPNSALTTPANYPVGGTPQHPDLKSVYHFALTQPGVASGYQGCSTIKVPIRPAQPKRDIRLEEQSLRHQLAVLRSGGPAAARLFIVRVFGGSLAKARLNLEQSLQTIEQQATGFTTQLTFETCPPQDLRTLIVGFAGPSATAMTITGRGVHATETLTADDDGFYLFVLSQHWSFASRFQAVVACRDGHTVTGEVAPGTPHAPYCR